MAIGTFKRGHESKDSFVPTVSRICQRKPGPGKASQDGHVLHRRDSLRKVNRLAQADGFQEVYHLRGGILKYLEEVDEDQSLWEGECFVFDGRVSVGHGLRESDHVMCFGCGWPVTLRQQQQPEYVPGVQCPRCAGSITESQRERFAERQRQHEQMESPDRES